MKRLLVAAALLLAASASGFAADTAPVPCPPDPGLTLPQSLFPQPLAAGALSGRRVLAPLESQPVLARVRDLQRGPDGGVQAILLAGGFLARFDPPWHWGARLVTVPLSALALLGDELVLIGLSPAALNAIPSAADTVPPIPADTLVCLGLTKPAH